ncbi:MAG: hypothetical protein ACRC8S_10135 [Fimbriiglobus sp.]
MILFTHVRNLAALGLLLCFTGCGPSTTTATGKAMHKGKPVVYGSVTVIASDGTTHQAGIELDGTFTLKNVPTGSAKFGITSPTPPSPAAGRARGDDPRASAPPPGPPAGAWFAIPDTYADPNKSGLTIEIKSGSPITVELP